MFSTGPTRTSPLARVDEEVKAMSNTKTTLKNRFTKAMAVAMATVLFGGVLVISLAPTAQASTTDEQVAPVSASTFTDVPESMRPAVDWAVANGIVQGFSPTRFGPTQSATRAQFMMMLWRYAGRPAAQTPCGFSDVPETAGYAEAVCWARENGHTTGTSATRYSPDSPVTRAQAAIIVWRYAGQSPVETPHGYTDIRSGSLADDAVRWAKLVGLTNIAGQSFVPNSNANRFAIAAFIQRFEATNNPFGNVDAVTSPVANLVAVQGWTADPNNGNNPVEVHVYVDGQFAAASNTGAERPDIAQAYPQHGNNTGFEVVLDRLVAGTYNVCVYAINVAAGTTNPPLACREVTVADRPAIPFEEPTTTLESLLAGYLPSQYGADRVAGDIAMQVNEPANRPLNRVVVATPTWMTLDSGESLRATVRGECVASGDGLVVSRLGSNLVVTGFTCADNDIDGEIVGSISIYLRNFAHSMNTTGGKNGLWVTYDNDGDDRRSPVGITPVRFADRPSPLNGRDHPTSIWMSEDVSPLPQVTMEQAAKIIVNQLAEDPITELRLEFTNTTFDFDTNRNLRAFEAANSFPENSIPSDHTNKAYSDLYHAIASGECSSDPSFFNGQFGRQEFYPVVAVDNVLTVSGFSCDDKNDNGYIDGRISVRATWIDTGWKSILRPGIGECPVDTAPFFLFCLNLDDFGPAPLEVNASYTSDGVSGRDFPTPVRVSVDRGRVAVTGYCSYHPEAC